MCVITFYTKMITYPRKNEFYWYRLIKLYVLSRTQLIFMNRTLLSRRHCCQYIYSSVFKITNNTRKEVFIRINQKICTKKKFYDHYSIEFHLFVSNLSQKWKAMKQIFRENIRVSLSLFKNLKTFQFLNLQFFGSLCPSSSTFFLFWCLSDSIVPV